MKYQDPRTAPVLVATVSLVATILGGFYLAKHRLGYTVTGLLPVEFEVTAGSFWGVRMGASARDVLASLRQRGAASAFIALARPIEVRPGEDVSKLSQARQVLITPGDIRVQFRGDSVEALEMLDPQAEALVGKPVPRSRQEFLNLAQKILSAHPSRAVLEYDSRAEFVDLGKPSESVVHLLEELGRCSAHVENWSGYWFVEVDLVDGRVGKMRVMYSPIEFL